MSELRHAFAIRTRIHVFVMVGGTLLLVSGLLLGLINSDLFHQGWYIVSLFLIALASGPIVLATLFKPIKVIMKNHQGEDIPEKYSKLSESYFMKHDKCNIFNYHSTNDTEAIFKRVFKKSGKIHLIGTLPGCSTRSLRL